MKKEFTDYRKGYEAGYAVAEKKYLTLIKAILVKIKSLLDLVEKLKNDIIRP